MKLAAFNAVCPFEIGDKIGMRKNACAVGGRTLDVIRNIALDRLAKRFEQNKQISRYVFPEK